MTKRLKKKNRSKKGGIEDRITPIKEVKGGTTALIYGRSGTGKTTLAGTFPKPLLLVDVGERGGDSVSDIEGVSTIKIDDWDDFESLYRYIEDNPKKFKTIVVDALHTLQDCCLKKVLDMENKEWGQQVTIKNYGQIGNMMKKWLLSYRDLRDDNLNIVFLAHDRIIEADEDDENNQIIPEVGPRLTPAVSSFVLGAVNVVGNTFIREETTKKGLKKKTRIEYCLRLGPNKFYSTKIRSPKDVHVPDYIVDPEYKTLLNIIKGETTKTKLKKTKRLKRKS